MAYNKWVSGQAAREFNSQRLKFNDILSNTPGLTKQNPNDSKADNVLPYPLPNIVSILGDLTTDTTNTIRDFKIALKSPALTKNTKAQKELIAIIKHLEASQKELESIFKIVGKEA